MPIRSLFIFLLSGCLFVLASCSAPDATKAVIAADMVYQNARIYTLDPDRPWADSLAVSGDSIVFVGDGAASVDYIGKDTQVIDVAGKMILPGFIDTHMHIGGTIPYMFAATLSPDMSAEEVLQALAAHAQAYPEQSPLLGIGFLGAAFGETGPTAAALDTVVSDRPAIIFDEGFHSAWINTAAMEQVGLSRASPDPVPGAHYYKRYPDGAPTGWLIEGGAFTPVAQALGTVTLESLRRGAEAFLPIMTQLGITAAFDAGLIGEMSDETLGLFEQLIDEGDMPVRMVGSHYVNTPEVLDSALNELRRLNRAHDSEFLQMRVLKLSLDGTVEASSAYMLDDYLNAPGHRSQPLIPEKETAMVMLEAVGNGTDIHIHAIGDAAVRLGLDLVESARSTHPDSPSRYTMCHVQVVNPADVPRFGQLDVIAQSTPTWYGYDEYALAVLGRERFEQMYPLRSMAAGGARLTFGSDYPASWMGLDGLNPLFNIEMSMTRKVPGMPDIPAQPLASEVVSLEQALRAYTIDAAYQLNLEQEIGSLEAGKQADLVVLSANLFDLDPGQIHGVSVVQTMVNGKVVYETPGQ